MGFLDLHPKRVHDHLKPLHQALNDVRELEDLEEHDIQSLKNLEKMLDQLSNDVLEGTVEIKEMHVQPLNQYLERTEDNLQLIEQMVEDLLESLQSE